VIHADRAHLNYFFVSDAIIYLLVTELFARAKKMICKMIQQKFHYRAVGPSRSEK